MIDKITTLLLHIMFIFGVISLYDSGAILIDGTRLTSVEGFTLLLLSYILIGIFDIKNELKKKQRRIDYES